MTDAEGGSSTVRLRVRRVVEPYEDRGSSTSATAAGGPTAWRWSSPTPRLDVQLLSDSRSVAFPPGPAVLPSCRLDRAVLCPCWSGTASAIGRCGGGFGVGKASRGKRERSRDRDGQWTAAAAARVAHRLRDQTQRCLAGNPWGLVIGGGDFHDRESRLGHVPVVDRLHTRHHAPVPAEGSRVRAASPDRVRQHACAGHPARAACAACRGGLRYDHCAHTGGALKKNAAPR